MMKHESLIEDVGRRAPALLFMSDARGRLEYVNDRWTEFLGVPTLAWVGTNWMAFVHEEDLPQVMRDLAGARRQGEPYRGQFRMCHNDGAFRWIEVRAEAERDGTGEVVRWFGAGNDVDAQRRAMDALQLLAESGASANSAVDVQAVLEGVARAALTGLADIAFFDLIEPDGEGRRVVVGTPDVSLEAIATTKAFPPPRIGQPHPIARAMTELHAMHVARVDDAYIEGTIEDPARREAWRSVGIRSLIVAPMVVAGRRLGALTMLRTLTNRPFEAADVRVVEEVARRAAVAVENIRLTEAARSASRASERQFRAIADSMPMLMWTTRADGTTDWHNRRWHDYTGQSENAPPFARWSTLHPDDVAATQKAWRAVTESGETLEIEHRLRRSDGTFRWFLTRAIPERDTNGTIVRWYGTNTDVDDARRALERERRVARSFQEAALPAILPNVPACSFSAIYEAGSTEALIGGDWYDAFALADGRIVFSIGDVAGSGLEAAVTMGNMRQAIRGVAYVHPDPILMLEAADLTLRSESPDRFVTAFVGVIDPVEDTISFAMAGHPPPFLCAPDGSIVPLEAHGLPLGLRVRDGSTTISRPIAPGSMLVLFTDGLIESTHDIDEGYRRLDAALHDPAVRTGTDPAARIRDAVLIEGSRDDVAILCARYAGTTFERHRVDVRRAEGSAYFAAQLVSELRRCEYSAEAILNAEIVLAELVGNLVRHAPGEATFVIDGRPGHVVLHVLDNGPGYRFLSRLPTDTFSERGRGLFLISALAQAFHVTLRAFGGSHACVTFAP